MTTTCRRGPCRIRGLTAVPGALAGPGGFAPAAPAQDGPPVTVGLDLFGAGGAYRPGDPVGIRVEMTSSLDEPTPVVVQWEIPNAEGDIAELSRSATLTPGVPTQVW